MRFAAVTVTAALALCCAPAAQAVTGDDLCKSMKWPMPLPSPVGYSLMHMTNDSILTCFDNVSAIAPDGHDAVNDSVQKASFWRVTSMNPPAGTMVPMDQKIKLTVVWDENTPD